MEIKSEIVYTFLSRLCLSMSDWFAMAQLQQIYPRLITSSHPQLGEESTAGSITTSAEEKRALAAKSLLYNLKDEQFVALFPELAERIRAILRSKVVGNRPAAA